MPTETSTARGLTPQELESYQRNGFLILREVFSPSEIEELDAEAEALRQREDLIHTGNIRCRWKNHIETGECMFEAMDPVIDVGSICRQIAADERILAPLRDIYGCQAHLFKDKLIYKPPGAQGYGLHQDYIGWKSFPRSFVTVLVPIDPSTVENGCTIVYPGYQWNGAMAPEDGDYHELTDDQVDESRAVPLELAAGDIAIFGAFTPHRSRPNRSQGWRRQLYVSYNADDDGGEQRDAHYREFHDWLRVKYAQYGKTDIYFK